MKKMKRMLAVLLTAIMTLAMPTTAFAATPSKGTLTVTVNDKNTLKDQTIKVYKLFDLTVSGTHYAYTVNETYKSTVAEALGLPAATSSEELYKKLSEYTENALELQTFADTFTEKALTKPLAETATSGKLGEVTSYTFPELDYGYYLVYQTGTKKLQSSLVSVAKATGTSVSLKGEAPSIDKTADKATVAIGEVVTYTINGIIPDTTGYKNYTYKIHDSLTDGLDFVKDASGSAIDQASGYSVSVTTGGITTSQNAQLSGTNSRSMTLDLSAWVGANQGKKGQAFTVTYYAKVNKDAVVQTNNSAALEYGNDPGNTTITLPDVVRTPTYPLDVKKTDMQGVMLAGAQFRVYRNENDAKAANENAIKVIGDNGSYTVAVDQTAGNMDMTTLATDIQKGYNLHLNGLAAGTYWLVEKEAPAGYNKLTTPVKVTITQDGQNELQWSVKQNDVAEEDKIIDVANTTGNILPGTGGMGTVLFTIVGIALILIIAASFVISRRKRA